MKGVKYKSVLVSALARITFTIEFVDLTDILAYQIENSGNAINK